MTNYNERLDKIATDLWAKYGRPGTMDEFVREAKAAIITPLKSLLKLTIALSEAGELDNEQ